MKIFRHVSAALFATALCSIPVLGQGARPAAQTPPAAAQASVPVPATKLAMIDSRAFYDEKVGITRLVAALQNVNREFKPRQDAIQALQADVQKRTTDLQTMLNNPVVDQTQAAQQNAVLEQKKKDLQRMIEDAQAAITRARVAAGEPIETEIGRAIGDFATKRGFSIIIDLSGYAQGGLLYLAPGMDVTDDFIKEFNARPASSAPAGGTRP
jgi:outer membrane protein